MALILGLLIWLLRIAGYVLVLYCIMTIIAPQNELVKKVGAYIEPLLAPIRKLLFKYIPSLEKLPVDVTPLAAWLVLSVAMWILSLLRGLFA